ncbi:hypothetical protein LY90DRAFT_670381 [Neocallimastix californiae]|uniref:Ankyrin n=1 Tax=Neocallimastix californiae TaxID=1754190 RepID=A0A1Y2D295_9FUNG|nr:hypothetical protein LY90DRAFT_670381 [Neocallimastix californiae]|eukprot:ORY53370.1 hypothetical protein LY90DRAFT_670381 [Neocallimastix californiae]
MHNSIIKNTKSNNIINNNINEYLLKLIKNVNEKQELTSFLKKNLRKIKFDGTVYELAFTYRNLDAIELFCKFDKRRKKSNQTLHYQNIKCSQHLKYILRNGFIPEISVDFIVTRLYFDNEFILTLLFHRRYSHQLARHVLKKMINKEKFKIHLNDIKLLKECLSGKEINKLKILIQYANQFNVILNINEKDKNGIPLLYSVIAENSIELVKLIIDYAEKNNIILNLNVLQINDDPSNMSNNPLNYPIFNGNTEMVKLLMEYANKNNILLELNVKENNLFNPFLWAIYHNNIEMSILEYLHKNKIVAYLSEHDINKIAVTQVIPGINIKETSNEIISLLNKYEKEKTIEIEYCNSSVLLERFKEIES